MGLLAVERIHADDTDVFIRPDAGALLSVVSSGAQEVHQSALGVGPFAFSFSSFQIRVNAATLRSNAERSSERAASADVRISAVREQSGIPPADLIRHPSTPRADPF